MLFVFFVVNIRVFFVVKNKMIILPAIDLKNGCCVRLTQGEKDRVKIYDQDPVAMAERFAAAMPADATPRSADPPAVTTDDLSAPDPALPAANRSRISAGSRRCLADGS